MALIAGCGTQLEEVPNQEGVRWLHHVVVVAWLELLPARATKCKCAGALGARSQEEEIIFVALGENNKCSCVYQLSLRVRGASCHLASLRPPLIEVHNDDDHHLLCHAAIVR